jgi:PAS domain S-box-containing protein
MIGSEVYLKTVIETMQDGLMVVDQDGMIVSVNQAMCDLTGFSRDELLGNSCEVLNCDVCAESRASTEEHFCELFALGEVGRRRCQFTKKNGDPLYVMKNAAVLRDEDGDVLGGVETVIDISEMVAKDRMISDLRREMGVGEEFHGILGKSPAMMKVYNLVTCAAESEAPVLIFGESGTGKELVATAIHQLGPRSSGPFIKVNCAALNESLLESELFGHVKGAFTGAERNRIGRFEAASGGDFFLDEIGDLPLSIQVKLLRVLQEKVVERVGDQKQVPVDLRVISATNKDLKALMRDGVFREDLYYRVGVIPIYVPPLRERKDDIPILVGAFVNRIRARSGKPITGVAPEALGRLMNHHWPGNVRELINVIEYAFVLCRDGDIQIEHLPPEVGERPAEPIQAAAPTPVAAPGPEADEKERIVQALRQAGGRKTEAARLLGISRVTLWKKLKKYDIEVTPTVTGP